MGGEEARQSEPGAHLLVVVVFVDSDLDLPSESFRELESSIFEATTNRGSDLSVKVMSVVDAVAVEDVPIRARVIQAGGGGVLRACERKFERRLARLNEQGEVNKEENMIVRSGS
jgi:hypothetical protein